MNGHQLHLSKLKMPSISEIVTAANDQAMNVTAASYASVVSATNTTSSNSTGAPVPSPSVTPSTNKKGGKATAKTDSKKRKLGDGEFSETAAEKVSEMEKSVKFYMEAYEEMLGCRIWRTS